ncbi:MAG: hypothetical protein WAM81_04730 [Acidimicrobiia bacterium]
MKPVANGQVLLERHRQSKRVELIRRQEHRKAVALMLPELRVGNEIGNRLQQSICFPPPMSASSTSSPRASLILQADRILPNLRSGTV